MISTHPHDQNLQAPPLPVADALVGLSCGHYQLVERIGEGAMGVVYLAVQRQIGKRVAVKILHPQLCHDPKVIQRFFLEARLVNEIRDEHIVDILDLGQHEQGFYFMVMELLEGQSLASAIAKRPLQEALARHVGAQAARALASAHAVQVVHRDLKPENIFILERESDASFVKLLDFGIAKASRHATAEEVASGFGADEGPNPDVALTADNVIVGTPLYIAPEQIYHHEVHATADIYSLGCILFEMVVGRSPFEEESSVDKVLSAHLRSEPPPLRTLAPQISSAYEAITAKCLAKDPIARFQSAAELAAALQKPRPPVEQDEVTFEIAALKPSGRAARWVAVVLLVLSVAMTSVWLLEPPAASLESPAVSKASKPARIETKATPAMPVAEADPDAGAAAFAKSTRAPHLGPRKRKLRPDQRSALESLERLCRQGTLRRSECRRKRIEILNRRPARRKRMGSER